MNAHDSIYIQDATTRQALIEYLSNLVLDRRIALFKKVLTHRTRYITVVLEDIFQSQNASAVLRTCDCLGIQDVHVIENCHPFNINSEVDMSASKWLNIYRYNGLRSNTPHALQTLKRKGYRIVATSPHRNHSTLNDFDVSQGKIALLFGTELTGLSDEAMSMADEFITIPMYGFIESYNISVSAALLLYELTHKMRCMNISHSLNQDETEQILLQWLRVSIKNYDKIENRFWEEYHKKNLIL